MSHQSRAVLDELFEPVSRCLTPDVARRIAALRASPLVQETLDELAEKSKDRRDRHLFFYDRWRDIRSKKLIGMPARNVLVFVVDLLVVPRDAGFRPSRGCPTDIDDTERDASAESVGVAVDAC